MICSTEDDRGGGKSRKVCWLVFKAKSVDVARFLNQLLVIGHFSFNYNEVYFMGVSVDKGKSKNL